jgi:hypothetical protein
MRSVDRVYLFVNPRGDSVLITHSAVTRRYPDSRVRDVCPLLRHTKLPVSARAANRVVMFLR